MSNHEIIEKFLSVVTQHKYRHDEIFCKIASKLQQLFKETQVSHQDSPLTDEEIVAEIEAYRRGK